MSRPLTRSTALSPAWSLPMFLVRTAWGDQPFDDLVEYISGLAPSHLLDVVGDPVSLTAGAVPSAGPVGLLPGLVTTMRNAGRTNQAPEILALLTAAPGDYSGLPPVPAIRADVAESAWGVLVRDPASRDAVCLTCVAPHPEVLRWRARGVADCPVPPQPSGPAQAMGELGQAVIEAADLIERTAVGGGRSGPVDLHHTITRLPAGLPPRVHDLVDRIDRVQDITSAALASPGLGVAPAVREPVVRRLVAIKDAARRSAVAAAGDAALR